MLDKMVGDSRCLIQFFVCREEAQMKNQISMTEGKIGPALLGFAIPVLLSGFLQALYGAVDLFVVGQYDSSAAVSAVATGSQLMQTITGIVLGFSMGGTVLIGQAMGEKNQEKAAKAVGTLTVLFLIIAMAGTGVMLVFAETVTGLLHTPKEAFAYARQYIFICSLGIPFIVGYNAVSSIFRGMGDSRTPMYLVAIACIINVILDFLLVGGLGLGAAGAAAATIAAQGVSFLSALWIIRKNGFPFAFNRADIRIHKDAVHRICQVGMPLAVQDALVNVSFLLITVIINQLGVVASASVGVVEKLIAFAMLPPTACAAAVATMTAQNLGAGKPDRAWKALKIGIGYSLVFGAAICLYAQVWPETLTAIFSNDAAVIAAASDYLRAFSLDCILVCIVFCLNSYFSGSGKSLVAFAHSMIATFGVRIPLSYLLSRSAGTSLYQIGLAAPAASLVSIAICGVILWRGRRGR